MYLHPLCALNTQS